MSFGRYPQMLAGILALSLVGYASGQCQTDADCAGFGSTWGPEVGRPPAGCNPPGTCGGGGGNVDYTAPGLKVAPIRGTIGDANDGNLIFGPFEAGFSTVRKWPRLLAPTCCPSRSSREICARSGVSLAKRTARVGGVRQATADWSCK